MRFNGCNGYDGHNVQDHHQPGANAQTPARVWLMVGALALAGCGGGDGAAGRWIRGWGERGLMPGQLQKPRAIVIDQHDHVYLVDMRATIQQFREDGTFVHGWTTPEHLQGRPAGLGLGTNGTILVADSHYGRILEYDRQGILLRQIGGESTTPTNKDHPTFGYVADVAVDSRGNIYVAEAQQQERITKLSPEGKILARWGSRGPKTGQFQKLRALAVDVDNLLYAADACNHRVQVFDGEGHCLRVIGFPGTGPGQLSYPYDVALGPDNTVYVCEYGNHRVQRFTRTGTSLGFWGKPGRGQGQLWNPWAVAVNRRGRVLVVDSNNHRVQEIAF